MKSALLAVLLLTADAAAATAPATLRETGLYVDGTLRVRPDHVAFAPQYPLWSDGAVKRRWISIPAGRFIDASTPDAWDFPVGTRLWKEFGYEKPVETRYIERLADGSWLFAAYVWNAAGTEAVLAPARGIARHATAIAPGGRYDIPAQDDCRACHEGGRTPVLGFSALQLSGIRDPLAPHGAATDDAIDLQELVARGLVRNVPALQLAEPPRIPASSPIARAALGYLHGNCGHCHNGGEAAPPVDLRLQQDGSVAALDAAWRSLTQGRSQYQSVPGGAAPVITPGNADASVLVARMRSRAPADQMPPLGTRVPDAAALALVERWIDSLEPTSEKQP